MNNVRRQWRMTSRAVLLLVAIGLAGCEGRRPQPMRPPPGAPSSEESTSTGGAIAARPDPSSGRARPAGEVVDSPETAAREQAMQAEAERLRRRLGDEFHIRCQWPFVAAGDISRARFDSVFEVSLLESYRCLRRDYFTADLDRHLTVYLFRDEDDYRRHAADLFGDDPDTPFGYYSPTRHALIMNINQGRDTGTLVHELTHPLVDADFPECPTWFNEGLASLHEQCMHRDGSLVGLPNWRLPHLQKAIRAGTALPLGDLMEKTTPTRFYGEDKGLNYATARYLCQYLQHHGKLKAYYAQLKADIDTDPTGEKTLETLLGSSLEEIEPAWRQWVMTLRFRR